MGKGPRGVVVLVVVALVGSCPRGRCPQGCKSGLVKKSETLQLMPNLHGCANISLEW